MLDKTKFYIDGQWVAPIDGTDFPVINPATEEAYATISLGGKKDAEAGDCRGQSCLSGMVDSQQLKPVFSIWKNY